MTSIEWTDETWNPVVGCSRVSAGCERCYAERVAHRAMQPAHAGLTISGPKGPRWTGKVRCLPERLEEPLRWRKPRRVFVNSMSDLFHEGVPDEFIDRVFAVMALARRHTFQVLTKRPERMRAYTSDNDRYFTVLDAVRRTPHRVTANAPRSATWPLPNVWLGCSIENQATADERIPLLLQTPAAVRFVSAEPLLGPVDFTQVRNSVGMAEGQDFIDALGGRCWTCSGPDYYDTTPADAALDLLIVGGESGPGARPCHVEWIRSVVQQCRAARTACFVKQFGRMIHGDPSGFTVGRFLLRDGRWWVPPLIESDSISVREYVTSLRAEAVAFSVCDLKGGNPAEWPEDLRVREMPPAGPRRA